MGIPTSVSVAILTAVSCAAEGWLISVLCLNAYLMTRGCRAVITPRRYSTSIHHSTGMRGIMGKNSLPKRSLRTSQIWCRLWRDGWSSRSMTRRLSGRCLLSFKLRMCAWTTLWPRPGPNAQLSWLSQIKRMPAYWYERNFFAKTNILRTKQL